MPKHHEERILPYTQQQLFALVSDIEHYPEFVPWVSKILVLSRARHEIVADMVANFKGFTERFRSLVTLHQPGIPEGETEWAVYVDLIEGPFKHLENHWIFHLDTDSSTRVEFHIDFTFKSRLLESMVSLVFKQATQNMIHAFEERAKKLYPKSG